MNIAPTAIIISSPVAAMPIAAGSDLSQIFQNLVTDFGTTPSVSLPSPGSVPKPEPVLGIAGEANVAAPPVSLSPLVCKPKLEPANIIVSEASIAPTLPVIPGSVVAPVLANMPAKFQPKPEANGPIKRWPIVAVSPTPMIKAADYVDCDISDDDDILDAETVAIGCLAEAVITATAVPIVFAVAPKFVQTTAVQDAPVSPALETLSKPISAETPLILPAPMPAVSVTSTLPSALPAIISQDVAVTGHLDLARDALWLDQLTREIVAVASNDGRLRFTLSPQTLGSLDVAISTEAGGVNIQLQTSTESAARIMAAEQPKLAEELRQSGVKLVSNDLINNQQMGSRGEHSQARDFASQTPIRVSGHAPIDRNTASSSSKRLSGRFA